VWGIESILGAVKAVRDKEMGLLKASKIFDVPTAAPKYYAKSRCKEAEDVVTARMGRKPVLPVQIENEIVNYCFIMKRHFSGLTTKYLKNDFSVGNKKQSTSLIFCGKNQS
jgi:hypothetical protein